MAGVKVVGEEKDPLLKLLYFVSVLLVLKPRLLQVTAQGVIEDPQL